MAVSKSFAKHKQVASWNSTNACLRVHLKEVSNWYEICKNYGIIQKIKSFVLQQSISAHQPCIVNVRLSDNRDTILQKQPHLDSLCFSSSDCSFTYHTKQALYQQNFQVTHLHFKWFDAACVGVSTGLWLFRPVQPHRPTHPSAYPE